MREAGLWNKLTRKPGAGVHAYIHKEALVSALEQAGIAQDAELVMRVSPLKTNWRGRARIIVEIKAIPSPPDEAGQGASRNAQEGVGAIPQGVN